MTEKQIEFPVQNEISLSVGDEVEILKINTKRMFRLNIRPESNELVLWFKAKEKEVENE